MYLGEHHTVLDDKNRVTVPRKFREIMSVHGHIQWYMTKGYDGSLFLFPRQEWDRIREKSAGASVLDASVVDLKRILYGSVAEVCPDKQGRLPVPQPLREYANITREAVLVGVDEHLELWSKSNWQAYQERIQSSFKTMASEFFGSRAGADEERVEASAGASHE